MDTQVVCARNDFPVGWRLGSHAHRDYHELVLVIAGTLWTRMEGQESIAGAGMLVTHPAGIWHAEAVLGGRPLVSLYLGFAERRAGEVPLLAVPVVDREGRIEGALRWMIDLAGQGTVRARGACSGLLEAVLHEVQLRLSKPEDEFIERVRRYVDANLREPLLLNDLARAAGLSRHHFARSFHRASGTTPMGFVRRLRIQRARHLLLTTELPLVEIARQVGIPDRFHFSRVFSQLTGTAPSRLRTLAD